MNLWYFLLFYLSFSILFPWPSFEERHYYLVYNMIIVSFQVSEFSPSTSTAMGLPREFHEQCRMSLEVDYLKVDVILLFEYFCLFCTLHTQTHAHIHTETDVWVYNHITHRCLHIGSNQKSEKGYLPFFWNLRAEIRFLLRGYIY